MKKYLFRSLSVVLAVIMLMQVVPLHGLASNSVAAPALQLSDVPSAPESFREPSRHINEEVSLRTADSKLFNNEDGSGTAYVYPQAVHFADENGDWQEYDNTLVKQGDFYAPKASDLDIALPNVLGGSKTIAMHHEQLGFTLGVPGASSEAVVPDLNELEMMVLQGALKDVDLSEAKEEDFDLDSFPVEFLNEQMSAARNLESVIYYPEAFPDTHLEYTVLPEQIKENIYVMEKQEKYVYSYTLDLQNLVAVPQDERTIHLFDAKTGDLKVEVEAPFAVDAAGEMNTQALTLELDGNTLTVTADAKWMNAKERKFPVTLDPTYQFSINENTMSNVSVNNKIERSGDLSFKLNVGARKGFTGLLGNTGVKNVNRSYLRFELPELPGDAVVTNATLMLDDNATPAWAKLLYWLVDFLGPDYATDIIDLIYRFMGQETRDYTVNVRAEMVLEEWVDDFVIWSNQPKTTGVALSIGNDDPEMPDRSWWQGKGLQGLHTFDITEAAKHWIKEGGNENYGIMLKAENEKEFNENFLQFASLHYEDEWFQITTSMANSAINGLINGVIQSALETVIPAVGASFVMRLFPDLVRIPSLPIHINRLDSEPIVSIQYVSATGLEDYFSYETVDMGRSGTGYVNHFNGALTYMQPVAEMSGERMPVGASLVYNSNHDRSTGELWNMKTGVGFRMSLFEQINPINNYKPLNLAEDLKIEAIDRIGKLLQGMKLAAWLYDIIIDALGSPRQYYTMIDGDGTEHCFVQHEDRQRRDEFVSEVNKKLILRRESLTEDGFRFVLEDEYGNQKVYTDSRFVDVGLSNPDELDEWQNFARRYYYLNTIRDANGNETNIFYDTDLRSANYGRIMKVIDTIGREFNFAYDGEGYLKKIIDQTGRVTQLTYNTTDYYVPVLDQITYHDNKKTQFNYVNKQDKNRDARNRTQLMAVSNPDEHDFVFGLDPVNSSRHTSYRVKDIQHGIKGSYTRVDNPEIKDPGKDPLADKNGGFWQRMFYWISKAVYDIVWNILWRPSWFLIDEHGRWYFLFGQPEDPIYGEDDYENVYTFKNDVSTTWLAYEDSRTTVRSSLSEAAGVTYAFDRIGRAVGARDNTTGENAFISYTQSDGVKNLPGFAAGTAIVRNLLGEPNRAAVAQDAFAGKESWTVTPSNSLDFSSTTKLVKDETYTLSLMAKKAPNSNAKLMITHGNDATSKVLTNEWERYIVTFKSSENKKCKVKVEASGGDILVDAVQLEKNNTASPYNHLANSYFSNHSAAYWALGSKEGEVKTALDPVFKDDYLLIEGELNKEIALEQKISLNKDAAGQMLLFGATASILSVRDEDEKARVSVEFFDENGKAIVLKEKEDDEEERIKFLEWIRKWLKGENPPWPDEWRQIRPVEDDDDKITNVDGSLVFANFNRDIRPLFEIKGESKKWFDFFNRANTTPSITYSDEEKGLQTVATAYVIPKNAEHAMFYISYDNQATGERNAMRVQEAFAYIGAGGTIFDYMGGKLTQAVSSAGTATYTWQKDGPNVEKVEITRPPSKKDIDEEEEDNELNPRTVKTEYTYDSKNNVTSMTESRDDGDPDEDGVWNYLVTKTTYNYKTAKTSTYRRDSRFLNINLSNDISVREDVDIGGILLGSTVMSFTCSGPKEAEKKPANGVTPLANTQAITYINDCNDVKRVDDSSSGQWVEYTYCSRENNIPDAVTASDNSRYTYHYNEFEPPVANNAFDLLTGIKAYDGDTVYQNEYQYTGFGAGQSNTVSGLLSSIERNDTKYSFNYDIFGQVETVKIGGQTLVTNKYFGEAAEKADDSGQTRRFALEERSYANNFKYQPTYDERGRVVGEHWNGSPRPSTEYIYGNSGLMSRIIDNDSKRSLQFDYDMQGRLTGVDMKSDAPAAITSSNVRMGHGNDGELKDLRLLVNDSQLSRVRYTYDVFDRPWQTTLENMGAGRGLQYNYDAETGRLNSTTLKLDGAESYAFTQFSYEDTSANINGQTALLAGKVTEMTNVLPGGSTTFGYTYQPGSSRIASVSESGAALHSYTYDKIGQLTKDQIGPAGDERSNNYTYDTGGNLTKIVRKNVVVPAPAPIVTAPVVEAATVTEAATTTEAAVSESTTKTAESTTEAAESTTEAIEGESTTEAIEGESTTEAATTTEAPATSEAPATEPAVVTAAPAASGDTTETATQAIEDVTIKFEYGGGTSNPGWKDQLTKVITNGVEQNLTYDEIGNLTDDGNYAYTWQKAKQLASIQQGSNTIASYTYDYTGLRSSKTTGDVTTNFLWAGGLLMAQIASDGSTIAWSYDAAGKMLGFTYNTTPYFYLRNLQGDVVAIHDAAGNVVATYDYDAWGNILDISGAMGYINPIRYRGYYYDTETKLYYLQSRYYNSEWGRFISADVYADTGDGILGTNMYAYCQNDPVNKYDPSGTTAQDPRMMPWNLLSSRNEIHLQVQDHIMYYNPSVFYLILVKEAEVMYKNGKKGYADIVSLATGEVWDIKPTNAGNIMLGWTTVNKYLRETNIWTNAALQNLHTRNLLHPGRDSNVSGSFIYVSSTTGNVFDVWYNSIGSGVISYGFYDITPQLSKSTKQALIEASAGGIVIASMLAPALAPTLLGLLGKLIDSGAMTPSLLPA